MPRRHRFDRRAGKAPAPRSIGAGAPPRRRIGRGDLLVGHGLTPDVMAQPGREARDQPAAEQADRRIRQIFGAQLQIIAKAVLDDAVVGHHQSPVGEFGGEHVDIGQRHAVGGNGVADRENRRIESEIAVDVEVDAALPGVAAPQQAARFVVELDMEQVIVGEEAVERLARMARRRARRAHRGDAHHPQEIGHPVVDIGLIENDRHVDLRRRQAGDVGTGDVDADVGMFGVKVLDHRQRDLVQQRRRDVDPDRAATGGVAADGVHRLLDPVEGLADLGQQCLARRGQHQPRPGPIEQLAADQFLQADDVAADGALRDVERQRAAGEAQPLSDGVERPQGIQRQPATIDGERLDDGASPAVSIAGDAARFRRTTQ